MKCTRIPHIKKKTQLKQLLSTDLKPRKKQQKLPNPPEGKKKKSAMNE
jgi:hypothetical protein